MEINPYVLIQAARSEVGLDETSAHAQKAFKKEEPPVTVDGDRVEVVKTQNLAAAEAEVLDVESAFRLLDQVERELPKLQKQELEQMYRYDYLRDIFAG